MDVDGVIAGGYDVDGVVPGGLDVDGVVAGGLDVDGVVPGGYEVDGVVAGGLDVDGDVAGGYDVDGVVPGGYEVDGVFADGLDVDGVVAGGVSDDGGDERLNDIDFSVQEAMRRLPGVVEVSLELRPCDIDENVVVEQFMHRGCGCRKWDGKPCSQRFPIKYVKDIRLSFKDLSSSELDLVVMGQLLASTNTSGLTFHSLDRRQLLEVRKKSYTNHYHQGKLICSEVFRFLHGIGTKRLKNISLAMKLGGVRPRVHGNTRRLPKNTLSLSSVEYVVRFLLNYTEQHGLLLPGRVPGYSRDDIKL